MSQNQNQGFPPQQQDMRQETETKMTPRPDSVDSSYKGSGKLQGKTAIITGGDSGIGKSAAIYFAKEGANVVIAHLEENADAKETRSLIEQEGVKCLFITGDIGEEEHCQSVVQQTIDEFGSLDILVNNAAEQHPQESILDITKDQMERTFKTNIFGMFHLTKAALPHMKKGASIINTASITAYEGHPKLIDYSSTKGAIVSFTRALSNSIVKDGIRVNAVAPGPIWTPLIPSTFSEEEVEKFGQNTPMGRAGQPEELAPAYVFLASDDSSYISGQVIHINGGKVVNG
ncbi:NAD(P)-dependent dehydrogenase (short-subunit alcohol dehydrogenase family) [Peribacillus deserti]|uniref:NAD(P)-dependent dehydrogenase (Short-subunit alcohol dehydrogenase family) n=1 Tax=Peribacillus deserti TaxID=673318 RepID=A0ABS2QLE6_9BACI|nr:SDR family oxidoreductase [Peribacillus deserti]MBM7693992.1 NAD(P)-dependent dehydrogenase (short-subunit alcohol dehydrogenase family) [Peribacillus deserti]